MNFESFETERLILRKLTAPDFNYIFENYTEAEVRTLLGVSSDDEYTLELNKYKKGYDTYNRSFVYFQMVDKANQQIIGGGGFHNWYVDHRRAELGYALKDESYKGRGLMTEALAFFIDYGFKYMDLNRIEAFIGPDNIASLKLISKYKFTREGALRQHYMQAGKLEDTFVFSLLRDEYLIAGGRKQPQ